LRPRRIEIVSTTFGSDTNTGWNRRGVLLDVLAVLVERGGADAMQLAARQRRLQHVGGVHRPLRLAGPDQRVQLVDEQHDLAFGGRDLLQHRLQPLLELAAILRAGDQGAEIERQQPAILQALRHVAVDDAHGQPFDDGGLADAGLADQHRIVLGAPRQHLDGAADLLVAADHRVELAVARRFGQVAGIFLERIIALLGSGRVRRAAFADLVDRRIQALGVDAGLRQRAGRRRPAGECQRQQQPLGGDVGIAGLLGHLRRGVEQPRHLRREVELAGAAALDPRQLGELRLDGAERPCGIAAGGLDQIGRQAFAVVEQDLQQMFGGEALMAAAQCQPLRRLHEAARPLGKFLEIHSRPPCPGARFAQHAHMTQLGRKRPYSHIRAPRTRTRAAPWHRCIGWVGTCRRRVSGGGWQRAG
jgi:hypothetical protein